MYIVQKFTYLGAVAYLACSFIKGIFFCLKIVFITALEKNWNFMLVLLLLRHWVSSMILIIFFGGFLLSIPVINYKIVKKTRKKMKLILFFCIRTCTSCRRSEWSIGIPREPPELSLWHSHRFVDMD